MNERIEQILGMDFKTFCRSVLLAQNRFAEFLKATPASGTRSSRASSASSGSTTRSAWRRCTSSGSTWSSPRSTRIANGSSRRASNSSEARAAADRSRERLTALEAAEPEVERLEKERDAAAGDAASAIARIATLTEIARALPDEAEVERHDRGLSRRRRPGRRGGERP